MLKPDCRSYTLEELIQIFENQGIPNFRGEQLFSWIHEKQVDHFQEMTNLPKDFRHQLEEEYELPLLELVNKQVSQLDGTIKYLFQLPDGNTLETVQMEYDHGTSLCISTQVGCRMGCRFCASTIGGLVRNLTTGELLQQVYQAEKLSGKRISNIVLMGIGEPLDNYDAVVKFLSIIHHPKGKNISLRNITLSTCGMVEGIYALADLQLPITLAISLHAPNDLLRNEIMPVNRKWKISKLLEASRYYFKKTGRRISFEYALIERVNDSPEQAQELATLLQGLPVHINLIPINPIPGASFHQSQWQHIKSFQHLLVKQGFSTTLRRELGRDITAACGQLRRQQIEK